MKLDCPLGSQILGSRTVAPEVDRIVDTYQFRNEEEERYAHRVSMEEIEKNDYNLNISRYVSITTAEKKVDLQAVSGELANLEGQIVAATNKHNKFLRELGLPLLPVVTDQT